MVSVSEAEALCLVLGLTGLSGSITTDDAEARAWPALINSSDSVSVSFCGTAACPAVVFGLGCNDFISNPSLSLSRFSLSSIEKRSDRLMARNVLGSLTLQRSLAAHPTADKEKSRSGNLLVKLGPQGTDHLHPVAMRGQAASWGAANAVLAV